MRLWDGCGAAGGGGMAAGRLRGGCGGCGAIAGRLRRDSRKAGGGTLQPIGGCAKAQKTAGFVQADFGPSGRTLQPI